MQCRQTEFDASERKRACMKRANAGEASPTAVARLVFHPDESGVKPRACDRIVTRRGRFMTDTIRADHEQN
jgi:hypothetical protein